MKKKLLITILLFAAVFCVTLARQHYSMMLQSWQGLFLLTPDWFREVFARPFPVSNLIASFLVQFYDISFVGALVTGLLVSVIFLCVDVFLSRCALPFHGLVSLLAACACWSLTASAPTNTVLVSMVLFSAALALLSLLRHRRLLPSERRWETVAAAAVICIAAGSVIANPSVRRAERMAKVQVCACVSDWDGLLEAASPQEARKDDRLMPFAFLALGEQGRLGDNLFKYPVEGPEDFDMTGDNSATGSWFNSILNEHMGSYNEAIHHIFQYSCHLPHGTSHISLLLLIRYNAASGHYAMVRKYAGILSRSPKNRRAVRAMASRYSGMEDVRDTTVANSAEARVVTNNPAFNIGQFHLEGLSSKFLSDRFLCYALLNGDLSGFRAAFDALDWSGGRIPVHYQEALLLAGADPSEYPFDGNIVSRFSGFMSAVRSVDSGSVESMAEGTYWAYYLKLQERMDTATL